MSTYATSTIKLYYTSSGSRWALIPSKLFVVDDIKTYLNTFTAKTVTLFQYIKPELEIAITVDISQTYSEPLSLSFKYVSIVNSDNSLKTYYYYVKKAIWRSKSSVRFELVMDVLNTFKEGTDYSFKDSTHITREHKDRFVIKGKSITLTFDDISSSVGSLGEDDTVVIRNMDQDNLYMITGVITQIDGTTITLVIQDDLTYSQLVALFDPATQYSDLLSVAKDNANYIESTFDDYNIAFNYFRNIDYIQENINPLLQCGNATGTKIEKSSPFNVDWFLLYRNQDDPNPNSYVNPVECYLIPSEDLKCNSGVISGGRVRPSYIEDGKYYYFLLPEGETVTFSNGFSYTTGSVSHYVYVLITKSNNKLAGQIIVGATILGEDYCEIVAFYDDLEYIEFSDLPVSYAIKDSYVPTLFNQVGSITPDQSFDNTEGNYNTLDGIKTLLRDEAKNIKLIKLPYCPYNFTSTGGIINTDNLTEWDYTTFGTNNMRALKLKDLNTALHTSLSPSANPLPNLAIALTTPSITDLRKGMEYESKLFNSEFYRPTYVYDSFQFVIQLEKCDLDYYIYSQNLTIDFDMTRTINSKFMFTFKTYYLRNSNESYAKYMPIARNNEEVLYNVPYINYIRTGFNYDVKAKTISNVSNWVGTGLSVAGVVSSFALPSAPLKALGIVTSLISLAMTTKNAIATTIQNEQSLDRKLKEAEMQTASVSGSDDVDLMSIYAENRLKYLVYEPNPVMKNMIFDLFYYAGYYSNRLGQPNHNTRANFDYLEADVQIENLANISDDILEELVNCFKNGVTYIHKTSRALNNHRWDMEQKFENWEKSLL